MVTKIRLMTVEEYEEFIWLPENVDRDFEFIAGRAVDILTSPYASSIAAKFGMYIMGFVKEQKLGHVTGAAGAYRVSGEYYMPDVGYISYERVAKSDSDKWYCPLAPNLAVEVVSSSVETRNILIKVSNYLAAGTVVWVVFPDEVEVSIHIPGQAARVISADGEIDGGDVLPGFKLALKNIFK